MASIRNHSIGHGFIELEAVSNGESGKKENHGFYRSEVVSMKHSYPLRYLVPEKSSPGPCRWIYPMTFGGGLVGGDQITSTVKVGEDCVAVVSSQESTKVYHCYKSSQTVQRNIYNVGESGLLCVLQDPIVCYQGADFDQKQIVEMTPTSNLVLLDWMLSGRFALDECWLFKRFLNQIEVQVSGQTVIRDSVELADIPIKSVAEAMQGFQVYGTCIVLGEQVGFLADTLSEKYSRKRDIGEQPDPDLVVSISDVSYDVQGKTISGCYLRFLAIDMTAASAVIGTITSPLLPILGADPFERKL